MSATMKGALLDSTIMTVCDESWGSEEVQNEHKIHIH
jgi:hypothetical protein